VAAEQGVPIAQLEPVLEALGAAGESIDAIPARLMEFVAAARTRAAEPIGPSNDGADIEAAIVAARARLNALDSAGARALLQERIEEERRAHTHRMLPLLRERAAVERLAFDHEAAKMTLTEITQLAPDDVWAWIDLGDLWKTVGDLSCARDAYRSAEGAARLSGNERDLSVSHNKIGDVLMAEGDREGALAAYRAGLAIRESLSRLDPGNTEWQRDLSVSHNKIGDVLRAEGDREGALAAYRAGLAIREALSRRDPGNTQWQRDLSVSHDRIGDVLRAEGERAGALAVYRTGLAFAEALSRRDPANTQWQRDLSVSHDRIGDVLMAEGDRAGALAAYRAGLAIAEALSRRDPANTQWQRDLIVSCVKLSEVSPAEARASLERALDIARRLHETGRLKPVDAWMVDGLAQRLAALPTA
jgi:tetratricopeptide (TPR) repeat protein